MDKPGAERGELGPLAAGMLPALAVAFTVGAAALRAAGVVDSEQEQAVVVLQPAGHFEDVGTLKRPASPRAEGNGDEVGRRTGRPSASGS